MSRRARELLAIGESLVKALVGSDSDREGLVDTPARFAKAWAYWTGGYEVDVPSMLTTFADGAEGYDEMVCVRGIPFYSHCEHHAAPFFGVAHVAYVPEDRIVGLSKLSRVVDAYARRLQVQERMTHQVVAALNDALRPRGAACVIRARHLCMESRGVRQRGSETVTSKMTGVFLEKGNAARAEFLTLAYGHGESL